MKLSSTIIFAVIVAPSSCFQHKNGRVGDVINHRSSPSSSCAVSSPLFQCPPHGADHSSDRRLTFHHRFDTLPAAGLRHGRTAGGGGIGGLVRRVKSLPRDVRNLTWRDVKPIKRIKDLHGPITYLVLAVLFANRYTWLWRNPAWWFGVAFCIKWIRARYVFKIPVWDRQPNWNNIITSKEQEKDLKAYTCKKCGSTIFIAKTREFFFEGNTGIGGLGCFSCGAKGADNFVMDRDRIVEDVADVDDYFEYERPLDFISRAERRALLKEAGGDEEKANQILVERTNSPASEESQAVAEAIVNGGEIPADVPQPVAEEEEDEMDVADEEIALSEVETSSLSDSDAATTEETAPAVKDSHAPSPEHSTAPITEDSPTSPEAVVNRTPNPVVKKQKSKTKKTTSSAPPGDDDFDFLGMDD